MVYLSGAGLARLEVAVALAVAVVVVVVVVVVVAVVELMKLTNVPEHILDTNQS